MSNPAAVVIPLPTEYLARYPDRNMLDYVAQFYPLQIGAAVAQTNTAPPITSSPKGKSLLKEPPMFDGNKEDFPEWSWKVITWLQDDRNRATSDKERINVTLSYMAGPNVDSWIQNYTKAQQLPNSSGNWRVTAEEFWTELTETFQDNMLPDKAQAKLDIIQQKAGETAEDYFKRFEVLLNQSGYDKDTSFVLRRAENGMNKSLVAKMYQGDTLPDTWETWKKKAIRLDEMWLRHQERQKAAGWTPHGTDKKQPTTTVQQNAPKVTTTTVQTDRRNGTGFTYSGQGKPMEIDRTRKPFNCYNCGKPGHISRNCPDKWPTTIRSLFAETTEEERSALAKEWGFVIAPQ